MSNNSATSSSLVIAQKAVKQLCLEASVRRIKVSQAAAELKTFCLPSHVSSSELTATECNILKLVPDHSEVNWCHVPCCL
ncbi:hypothetical protein Q5P01_016640 [Channa striata]|uniref:Guanine nucleotide-binding protein subunit gamma n=1 Tax=Channa striata TaxID=64152 RepID=A0AA88MBX2_CHASR|nr:hypothetical protein Q5P01_016640 [Channa striata]